VSGAASIRREGKRNEEKQAFQTSYGACVHDMDDFSHNEPGVVLHCFWVVDRKENERKEIEG
jgi:hypothetical protein